VTKARGISPWPSVFLAKGREEEDFFFEKKKQKTYVCYPKLRCSTSKCGATRTRDALITTALSSNR
jgi:hypothetical protein